ncbi:Hemin uptake protein hemP [Polaromonas sp. CF318]|uniref:hemin uptake protein HemP n=1 Tax=Polaromonas sp. CF318 TaxID=1144318 RepID=UPI00027110B0|nr:hemin uptake protein HemP [Polaromonas sp. CF318]EJL77979.1 Hemin uptake protein hemP [Polaromonas sp. CF318]
MSIALPPSNTLSLPARAPVRTETASGGQGSPAATVSSTEILRGQKAVEINHNGATYRLQATRLGKLILTK